MSLLTLTEHYNELISAVKEKISSLISAKKGTQVPNYNDVYGISVESLQIVGDSGRVITHITEGLAYDDDGHQYNLDYILDDNLESICETLDKM